MTSTFIDCKYLLDFITDFSETTFSAIVFHDKIDEFMHCFSFCAFCVCMHACVFVCDFLTWQI